MFSVGTPQDVTLQELRIETFFPADEASGAYLARALRVRPTPVCPRKRIQAYIEVPRTM